VEMRTVLVGWWSLVPDGINVKCSRLTRFYSICLIVGDSIDGEFKANTMLQCNILTQALLVAFPKKHKVERLLLPVPGQVPQTKRGKD